MLSDRYDEVFSVLGRGPLEVTEALPCPNFLWVARIAIKFPQHRVASRLLVLLHRNPRLSVSICGSTKVKNE